jgi:hypothetical protein
VLHFPPILAFLNLPSRSYSVKSINCEVPRL